jgi:hypothetical protein
MWNEIEKFIKTKGIGPEARTEFVKQYSWTLPKKEIIKEIKYFLKDEILVEFGAGLGLISFLLINEQVDVFALDVHNHIKKNNQYFSHDSFYTHITTFNKYELKQIAGLERNLMFCWPEFNKDWPIFYLKESLKYNNLNKLVFIGDPKYSADKKFHEMLEDYFIIEKIPFDTFDHINDELKLCTRKSKPFMPSFS